jgi:hypothetical protein
MKYLALALGIFTSTWLTAQNTERNFGQLHGNFQTNLQYYLQDTLIDPTGEAFPDERLLGAGFLNLTYTKGDFMAGVRYENYQNNLVGLPEGFQGEGIPYRFIRYKKYGLDVTAGSFYEQFGSGLVFRAYEERGLGLDNAMDGLRLIYDVAPGITAKGFIGRQRNYFENGEGIVRGSDLEFNLNAFKKEYGSTNLIMGASFVSRYQQAQDPVLNLPENVANGGLRVNLITGNFNFYAEAAYKSQDPNSGNNFIYRPGRAIYTNASYTKGSLGIIFGYKYYDNFLFRSERVGSLTELLINYQPPLAELHTYVLPALYAYNVQANGETGIQAEVSYKFKRGSLLGGKYGTLVNVNFSNSYALDKNFTYRYRDSAQTDSTLQGTTGYTVEGLAGVGDIQYSQDFNIEVKSKLNRSLKGTFSYYNFIYNRSALLDGVVDDRIGPNTKVELVYINAFVADVLWKIKPRHSLRFEGQLMLTEQDRESWTSFLAEYSIAPGWFFALQHTINFPYPQPEIFPQKPLKTVGNIFSEFGKMFTEGVQYPLVSIGYTRGTNKFQLTYGRQQEGVFCVGGICRVVPASNGFSMLITSNF